jgi:hypothetical protein
MLMIVTFTCSDYTHKPLTSQLPSGHAATHIGEHGLFAELLALLVHFLPEFTRLNANFQEALSIPASAGRQGAVKVVDKRDGVLDKTTPSCCFGRHRRSDPQVADGEK